MSVFDHMLELETEQSTPRQDLVSTREAMKVVAANIRETFASFCALFVLPASCWAAVSLLTLLSLAWVWTANWTYWAYMGSRTAEVEATFCVGCHTGKVKAVGMVCTR
jgi:hypothetical protein